MDTNPAINPELNQNPSAPIQNLQSTPTNSNPPEKKSKFSIKWILIILVIFGIIIAAGTGGYFLASNQNKNTYPIPTPTPSASTDDQVMCTQDAMECPDGSFVSRQGPACEFTACPDSENSSEDNASSNSYQGDGFTFIYSDLYEIDDSSDMLTTWSSEKADGEKYENQMYLMSQPAAFSEPKIDQVMYFNPPLFNPSKTYKIEEITKKEVKTINGVEVREYIVDCGADCQYQSIYFSVNDKNYRLEAHTAGGGLEPRFDELVSSLKFN